MPDDTQDAKAQKLAAARKKLKEYQQRCNNNVEEHTASNNTNTNTNTNSSTVSIASNLSERSDCELSLNNGGAVGSGISSDATAINAVAAVPTTTTTTGVAAYFTEPETSWSHNGQSDTNLQTIQVLIAEKAQLNTELTKSRHVCRERELELEELRTEHVQLEQRLEQLQQRYQEQQRSTENQRKEISELQQQLKQTNEQNVEQHTHLSELEAQLAQLTSRQDALQQEHASKCNELDMAQLKLRQLSDESHVNADNRIETLTQTQYMYEQQIRDLQQMVSQLTQDKEQAALQYQNYVAKLNERNSELSEESAQLKERERQLVEHVSGLEREIQKNLTLQQQYKEAASQQQQAKSLKVEAEPLPNPEFTALQERISDFEFERHEFQLKVKSQHDQLQLKDEALTELQQQFQRLQTEQPDQQKLMATMESDKVAASRALSQNVEMKQQLDELQQRFVQLTNDKLELVNKLDAEEFANREMRLNFANMEQKLQTNEERFKFKDEEMIRLSHENVELQRKQLMMQQQLDRLQHYEAKAYHSHQQQQETTAEATEGAVEAKEQQQEEQQHQYLQQEQQQQQHLDNLMPTLPTAEAVEKLQSRFTTLISQVADLTEEKHNLEHLVLQLQSETETIGEYIALYQTQRRMLKQREYEKAAQMRLLKAEREQLREKIDVLNKLVGSLGATAVETPSENPTTESPQHLLPTQNDNKSIESENGNENSQQILHKIQGIISEIKENTEQSPNTSLANTVHNTTHAVDHLNCCLGKFEVV